MESKTEEKKLSPMPEIENYIYPIDASDLQECEKLNELIINLYKSKISKPETKCLFLKRKEVEIKDKEISEKFTQKDKLEEDAADNTTYDFIFDAINFYHFVENKEDIKNIKEKKQISKELLKELFLNKLNDKGTLILFCDFQFLCQLYDAFTSILNKEFNQKLFIKYYETNRLPYQGIFCIQKMSITNEPIDLSKEKLLSYAVIDGSTMSKPSGFLFKDFKCAIRYLSEIYQYHAFFRDLHPGLSIPVNLREIIWEDSIDYTFTVIDTLNEELKKSSACSAIIISKNYWNDFLTISPEGQMKLCEETKSNRIILIRPAPFNMKSLAEIQANTKEYIRLFMPKISDGTLCQILLLNNEETKEEIIMQDKDIKIRDIETSNETIRQLIFHDSPNEIQSEVKVLLTSKTKIKKDKTNNYKPIYATDKYLSKGIQTCFDDSEICMYYIQALLTGLYFLDLSKYPNEKVNVLILGAGIGTINYYIDKILKGNVNINAVELKSEFADIGKKYFGTNCLKEGAKNIKWHFKDAKQYIEDSKSLENYYDLIIMDINNLNRKEGISPPPVFFEEKLLDIIKKMLKDSGVYIINLMARSYINYKKAFESLDKIFPNILLLENNEDLNKVHFCFKIKKTKEENLHSFANNTDIFKNEELTDFKIIEASAREFIKRLKDTESQKKKINAYVKLSNE